MLHRKIPEQHYLAVCEQAATYPDYDLTAGLSAYPLGVVFFPLVWSMSREGLTVASCLVMALQMILRRMGDFAST